MSNKQRRFADDGWAIWIDGDDRSTFYINEWVNPKGKSYVDVSVHVYGAKGVKDVNIFTPFSIEESEFCDLSERISDSTIFRLLFNSNGSVEKGEDPYTSLMLYDKKNVNLIKLTSEYVSFRTVSFGTVITIDFEYIRKYLSEDEVYLSFRLPHKTLDNIFQKKIDVGGFVEKLNSLVHSPIVSKRYGHSIRINEARLLPEEIHKIDVLQQQRIRKVLITLSVSDEFDMNDSTCYRIRRLEEDENKDFVPEGYSCQDVITYQWLEERSANMKAHYNFYFTMEHSKMSRISISIYLIIVLICGVLGCTLYDIIRYMIGL